MDPHLVSADEPPDSIAQFSKGEVLPIWRVSTKSVVVWSM